MNTKTTQPTIEELKNSKDIVDRTVWFINTLSPHNIWKGKEAIDDLLAKQKEALLEEIKTKLPVLPYEYDKKVTDFLNGLKATKESKE